FPAGRETSRDVPKKKWFRVCCSSRWAWTSCCRPFASWLPELPRPLKIVFQPGCDFLRHVGAGPAEFCAQTFLRGGPDHVALLIYQAHGGERKIPRGQRR